MYLEKLFRKVSVAAPVSAHDAAESLSSTGYFQISSLRGSADLFGVLGGAGRLNS